MFVAEADESDRSFLLLAPYGAIVTNVEADHLDNYGDLAAVEAAFDHFCRPVDPDGFVVVCADDPGARRGCAACRPPAPAAHLRHGRRRRPAADRPRGRGPTAPATPPVLDGTALGRVRIQVPGEHMALNSAAALLAGLELGLPGGRADRRAWAASPACTAGSSSRASVGGVRVYDDYAHHPTEVAAQLRGGPRGRRRAAGWSSPSSRTSTAGRRSSPRTSARRSGWPTRSSCMDVYARPRGPGARRDRRAWSPTPCRCRPSRVLFEPSWSAAAPALAAPRPPRRPGDHHGRRRRVDGRPRGPRGAARRGRRRDDAAGAAGEPRRHHDARPRRAGPAAGRAPAPPRSPGAACCSPAAARRRRRAPCGRSAGRRRSWSPLRRRLGALGRPAARRPHRAGRRRADAAGRRRSGRRPGSPAGQPLLRVDTGAAPSARRPAAPGRRRSRSTRGWPRHVRDHPRRAARRGRRRRGRAALAGRRRTGSLFDTVTGEPPAGVVPLDVADPGPDDPATRRRSPRSPRCRRGRGRGRRGAAGDRGGGHADPRPTAPTVLLGRRATESAREGRGARPRCSSRRPAPERPAPRRQHPVAWYRPLTVTRLVRPTATAPRRRPYAATT